jgi:hypothetical protein
VGDWVAKEEAKAFQVVYCWSRACDDLGFFDGHFVKFVVCCGLEMCGHAFQSRCTRICCCSSSRTEFNSSVTLDLVDLRCEKNRLVVGSSRMATREAFLHSALHVLLPQRNETRNNSLPSAIFHHALGARRPYPHHNHNLRFCAGHGR